MSLAITAESTILLQLLDVHASNAVATPITSATASCTVKHAETGVVVAGPIGLDAVVGSPGDYEGIFDGTVLDDGVVYLFEFTLDDGPGRHLFRRAKARAYIPS